VSYIVLKPAPTARRARADYGESMNDGIYFADPELPFHVWVRERTATNGYRWVLREAKPRGRGDAPEISDRVPSSKGDVEDSSR
jgi:hypothetical protein